MRHLWICAALISQSLTLPIRADDSAEFKEYKALHGEWELVSVETADKKLNLGQVTAKFRGTNLDFIYEWRAMVSELSISVNPAASPKAMNVTRRDRDETPAQLGIYKIEADVLTFVLYTHDDEAMRPRTFEMSPYKRGTKYVFKRIRRTGN